MRTYVILAQTLLITSLVNSAFAVPAPAPQVHDKRLFSAPSGVIFGGTASTAGSAGGKYGQVIKENAWAGLYSGLLAAVATLGSTQLINAIKNSTRRDLDAGTPFFLLKDPASHTHRPDSLSVLTDLSDDDLVWLSGMTRRALEELD